MRQWCLILLAGYPIGSRLTLGLPALLSRPALNMRGPRAAGMGCCVDTSLRSAVCWNVTHFILEEWILW